MSFCSYHRLPENHNCTGKKIFKRTDTVTSKKKKTYYKSYRKKGQNETNKRRPRNKPNISKKTRKKQDLIGNFIIVIFVIGVFILLHYSAEIVNFDYSSQINEIIPITSSSSTESQSSSATLDNSKLVNIPEILTSTTTNPINSFKNSPLSHSYPYYHMGAYSIGFTTYGGLADYLSKEDHTYRFDPDKEVIGELLENSYQDEYMEPLLNSIKRTSGISDVQAKVAISLVQHIPYDWNKYYGITIDWFYPYETLYHNKGVCADKSILLAYLLNKLGYDTVLFKFSNHMAVGVKCDSMYDFYDTGYAFIETTRPTIITQIPDTYLGGFQVTSNPTIIHLEGGNKKLDVSSEFRDATEYKALLSMGPVLNQWNYQKWQSLSKKYDLQYDT